MVDAEQLGDGGISDPVVYDTMVEAEAAARAIAARDSMLSMLSPEARAAWFESQDLGDVEDNQ